MALLFQHTSMRKKIIAANWKMNMLLGETEAFIEKFLREVGEERPLG